ncbi:MAG: hypothetical protein Q7S40_34750 [Opitutaceae bacterium]|nr:hypothetical protein [Opitutaceae bacterium]
MALRTHASPAGGFETLPRENIHIAVANDGHMTGRIRMARELFGEPARANTDLHFVFSRAGETKKPKDPGKHHERRGP